MKIEFTFFLFTFVYTNANALGFEEFIDRNPSGSEKSSAPEPVSVDGQIRPVDSNSKFLASSIRVACKSGFMSIAVNRRDLEANYGRVTGEQISFTDTKDESCRASERTSNSTHFTLATMYTHCQTRSSTRTNEARAFLAVENQIILHTPGGDSHRTVNISCLLSSSKSDKPIMTTHEQAMADPNATFVFTLSNRQWSTDEQQISSIAYPLRVAIGKRLYAQIRISSSINDTDLKAHVRECFFSPYSDARTESGYSTLISAGCPVTGSVLLHHHKSLPINRYSRFSFEFDQAYSDADFTYVHCKAVVCSLRGSRENEFYEKCPNSRSCADGSANDSVRSLFMDQSGTLSYVSSGPMQPFVGLTVTDIVDSCPPCPMDRDESISIMTNAEHQHGHEHTAPISVPMIQMTSVMGIAFASFIIGLLFMAGIWFVHSRTEPRRYLKAHQNGHEEDQECSTSSTNATSNVFTHLTST